MLEHFANPGNQLTFRDRHPHDLVITLGRDQELIADDLYKLAIIDLRDQYMIIAMQYFFEIFRERTHVAEMRMCYFVPFCQQFYDSTFDGTKSRTLSGPTSIFCKGM
jgi:hypothetical protein